MALDKDVLRQAVARERERRAGTPEATRVHRPSSPWSPRDWRGAFLALVVVAVLTGTAWYLGRANGRGAEVPSPPPSPSPGASPPRASRAAPAPPKVDPKVEAALRAFRDSVVTANLAEIESTLTLASETPDKDKIVTKAMQSGRSFDFRTHQFTRNRKLARRLHDPLIGSLNIWPPHSAETCAQLEQAFLSDPLDVEVSGNLAICYVRTRSADRARVQAMYSLSIPRPGGSGGGRTADWVTLGAAYASLGDQKRARAALFVALANVDDPVKRCKSAKYTLANTLGPVLREATEAMFKRIRDLQLTDDPACSLPLQ